MNRMVRLGTLALALLASSCKEGPRDRKSVV